MDRKRLYKTKSAISPIIATLLLILIAIAAGVIVYAYVIGFVGGTTSQGGSTSLISVDNFCISASTKCTGANGYYIVIRNVGSNSIPILTASSPAQLYFTDVTSQTSSSATCTDAAATAPGATYVCSGAALGAGFNQGDTVNVKIVNPDSGASTSSAKISA